MNIWADANGWPFPPTVLLGCLVAEILYFRGWRVLVKGEQAKEAARAMSSRAFTLMLVNITGIAGSGAASSSSVRRWHSCWQLLSPLTHSLIGSSGCT